MRRLRAVLRTPARDGRKLIALILVKNILTVFIQLHLDGGAEQIDLHGCSVSVFGFNKGTLLRNLLDQILIGLLLITQTAHQAAAAAGDLGGVKGEGLNLGHLGGDGMKVVQKLTAAVGTAADPEATQHLCLVPDADLSEFDAVV